jgi:hypothetical protein
MKAMPDEGLIALRWHTMGEMPRSSGKVGESKEFNGRGSPAARVARSKGFITSDGFWAAFRFLGDPDWLEASEAGHLWHWLLRQGHP